MFGVAADTVNVAVAERTIVIASRVDNTSNRLPGRKYFRGGFGGDSNPAWERWRQI